MLVPIIKAREKKNKNRYLILPLLSLLPHATPLLMKKKENRQLVLGGAVEWRKYPATKLKATKAKITTQDIQQQRSIGKFLIVLPLLLLSECKFPMRGKIFCKFPFFVFEFFYFRLTVIRFNYVRQSKLSMPLVYSWVNTPEICPRYFVVF